MNNTTVKLMTTSRQQIPLRVAQTTKPRKDTMGHVATPDCNHKQPKMLHVVAAMLAVVLLTLLPCWQTAAEAQPVSHTYTITVSDAGPERSFEAYQVFAGQLMTNSAMIPELTDVTWGDGVTERAAEDYGDAARVYTSLAEQSSAAFGAFAQELAQGGYLDPQKAMRSVYNGDQGQSVIAGVRSGCYLVRDVPGSGEEAEGFSYMPYVMRVAANVDVRCAAQAPILIKKVRTGGDDSTGGDWGVCATQVVEQTEGEPAGADLRFRLVVRLPENLDDYAAYPLDLFDWLPRGLEIDGGDVAVSVSGVAVDPDEGSVTINLGDGAFDREELADAPDGVAGASVAVDTAGDGQALRVGIEDVRALGASGGDEVAVEYAVSAQASDAADRTYAGLAYARYANDPNQGGELRRGVTAPVTALATIHIASAAELAASQAASGQTAAEQALAGMPVVAFSAGVLLVAAVVGIVTRERRRKRR